MYSDAGKGAGSPRGVYQTGHRRILVRRAIKCRVYFGPSQFSSFRPPTQIPPQKPIHVASFKADSGQRGDSAYTAYNLAW